MADKPSHSEVDAREALAREILEESRVVLMMSFRYLDVALWKMDAVPAAGLDATLATDGMHLYFNPPAVIERYRRNPHEMARDLLHTVLHCIFRHPFTTRKKDVKAWSAACDLCTESLALEICGTVQPAEGDAVLRRYFDVLRSELGTLTPAKVYNVLAELGAGTRGAVGESLGFGDLIDVAALCTRDDHRTWDLKSTDEAENPSNTGQDGQDDRGDGSDENASSAEDGASSALGQLSLQALDDSQNGGTSDDAHAGEEERAQDATVEERFAGDESTASTAGDGSDDAAAAAVAAAAQAAQAATEDSTPDSSELEAEWARIAERLEVDLQTFSRGQGDAMRGVVATLSLTNRKTIDYTDFLRRFSSLSEEIRNNDEEFDYLPYMYGLERFGNMPLIEPLEYQEVKRLREFVLAIDTSGSCSGPLVRNFVQRTCEIIRQSETFASRVCIHIIQCDSRVRDDLVIRSQEDLARIGETFRVSGFGGTDFRPVFAYVNELLDLRELHELQGLIYFTDGLGTYPTQAPPYPVAFVFVEENGAEIRVPPWAMRVVISQDQIREW